MVLLFSTGCAIYSQEMLQFLLLVFSSSIRILSARQTFSLLKILLISFILMPKGVGGRRVVDQLKVLTSCSCTCSFTVACADQGLVKFFSGAYPSQLCSVEPCQQHPVSVLSVAVMACGVNMDKPCVVRKTKLAALTFYSYFYSQQHVSMQKPINQLAHLSTAAQWLTPAPL